MANRTENRAKMATFVAIACLAALCTFGRAEAARDAPFRGLGHGVVAPPDPRSLVETLQQNYTELYDQHDFSGLASMYCEHSYNFVDGQYDYATIVAQNMLPSYFQNQYMNNGVRQINTTVDYVAQESATVIHEVGSTHYPMSTRLPGKYYIRWKLCDKMNRWVIDIHIMSLSLQFDPSDLSATPSAGPDPIGHIIAADNMITHAYEAENFDVIGQYYADTGKLLPLTIIQGFTVGRKPITAYWTGMSVARHVMDLTISMVSVTPDAVNPAVAYELGLGSFTVSIDPPKRQLYFRRWTNSLPDGTGNWTIDLDITPVDGKTPP